jgi:hypothetical protein
VIQAAAPTSKPVATSSTQSSQAPASTPSKPVENRVFSPQMQKSNTSSQEQTQQSPSTSVIQPDRPVIQPDRPVIQPDTSVIPAQAGIQATNPPQAPNSFTTKNWLDVLNEVKNQKSALFSVLKDSYFVESSPSTVTIALKQDFLFFREKIKEEKNRLWLSEVIQKVYGQLLKVQLRENAEPEATQSESGQTTAPKQSSTDLQREERINRIVALFEGTVV